MRIRENTMQSDPKINFITIAKAGNNVVLKGNLWVEKRQLLTF